MILLKDVHFSYHRSDPVLQGAELTLPDGLTLLVGPNGCGKSTLLRVAAGIEKPERGLVEIDGYDAWKDEVPARRQLAFVPEQPDLTPYASIRDVMNLVSGLRREPMESVRDALERAGLRDFAHRSVRELSMGQRRRAVLAAAWVGTPRILLLDEPLEAMDFAIRTEILAWVKRRIGDGASVVIATHEIDPFLAIATRVVTVRSGRIRAVDPLPADLSVRRGIIEALCRGQDPP